MLLERETTRLLEKSCSISTMPEKPKNNSLRRIKCFLCCLLVYLYQISIYGSDQL